eukprot:gene11692-10385_t
MSAPWAGLVFMRLRHPQWRLHGVTLSGVQHSFIQRRFSEPLDIRVERRSYDALPGAERYDGIFAVEAAAHSPSLAATLRHWATRLPLSGGRIALVDDFVGPAKVAPDDAGVASFAAAWSLGSLVSLAELRAAARRAGLGRVVLSRNFTADVMRS